MRLQNAYIASKIHYTGATFWKKPKNPEIFETFKKIARKLMKIERESKATINDEIFVATLFKKYGKEMQPGHLLGEEAYTIYREREGDWYYMKYTPRKGLDENTLKYLCEVRGESEEEVMESVGNAGVFSSAFIEQWRRTHGERKVLLNRKKR